MDANRIAEVLGWLKKSGPTDVAAVDAMIKDNEAQIAALRTLRKVLAARTIPAAETAGQEAPRQAGKSVEEHRLAVLQFLGARGRTPVTKLLALTLVPSGSTSSKVINHEWFDRTLEGVALSAAGRQALAELPQAG
jgi:hypothetical protein